MEWRKRAFDIAVGGLLAAAALPVIVVFAVVLAVELRCWPFFAQERMGRGGRRVRFPKLRTLPISTPRYALKHELDFAVVPGFARFLRERHLDELPQLALVVTGHLSLVGPRPKMPDEVEPVDARYNTERLSVAQGCTGLWQIGRHQGLAPHDHPEYDLFYVRHRSIRLDLWILWRTAVAVLGRPPITWDDVPADVCTQPVSCAAAARTSLTADLWIRNACESASDLVDLGVRVSPRFVEV